MTAAAVAVRIWRAASADPPFTHDGQREVVAERGAVELVGHARRARPRPRPRWSGRPTRSSAGARGATRTCGGAARATGFLRDVDRPVPTRLPGSPSRSAYRCRLRSVMPSSSAIATATSRFWSGARTDSDANSTSRPNSWPRPTTGDLDAARRQQEVGVGRDELARPRSRRGCRGGGAAVPGRRRLERAVERDRTGR